MLTENKSIFKKHMLSCKDVAHLASEYVDKNTSRKLNWKIRLHLLACGCCRRLIRHLKITQEIVPQLIKKNEPEIDAELILQHIKNLKNNSQE